MLLESTRREHVGLEDLVDNETSMTGMWEASASFNNGSLLASLTLLASSKGVINRGSQLLRKLLGLSTRTGNICLMGLVAISEVNAAKKQQFE